MDIRAQVTKILSQENYTFSQLADYLNMSEESLSKELSNKTLELRNLEAISKALRVPLYSFFRADGAAVDLKLKPVYINRMWNGDDDTKSVAKLQEEIDVLRELILLKEQRIQRLSA